MQDNRTSKRRVGDYGEEIACKYYIEQGYEIVDRNVNIAHLGEIDIIALHQVENRSEYVFIEVKTRTSNISGHGYESVTYSKRQRMFRCALAWINENVKRHHRTAWRLDVFSIDLYGPNVSFDVYTNIEM